jgi:hypothetical protein
VCGGFGLKPRPRGFENELYDLFLANDPGMLPYLAGVNAPCDIRFASGACCSLETIWPGHGKEFAKLGRAVYFYAPLLETIFWREE